MFMKPGLDISPLRLLISKPGGKFIPGGGPIPGPPGGPIPPGGLIPGPPGSLIPGPPGGGPIPGPLRGSPNDNLHNGSKTFHGPFWVTCANLERKPMIKKLNNYKPHPPTWYRTYSC